MGFREGIALKPQFGESTWRSGRSFTFCTWFAIFSTMLYSVHNIVLMLNFLKFQSKWIFRIESLLCLHLYDTEWFWYKVPSSKWKSWKDNICFLIAVYRVLLQACLYDSYSERLMLSLQTCLFFNKQNNRIRPINYLQEEYLQLHIGNWWKVPYGK